MLWWVMASFSFYNWFFGILGIIVILILLFLYILPFLIDKSTAFDTLLLNGINNWTVLLLLRFLYIFVTLYRLFILIYTTLMICYCCFITLLMFGRYIFFIKLIPNMFKNMFFILNFKLILPQKFINLLLQHRDFVYFDILNLTIEI